MVTVNGKGCAYGGRSVAAMVNDLQLDRTKIVVEVNQMILSVDQYDSHMLCEGDCVEVVRFVGGG